MRPDAARVNGILEGAQAIVDRFAHHTFETLASTSDAVKATFYDVIVIGEAMRDMVAKKDSSGTRIEDDSEIVKAHPEIPWVSWIGMRDMVTHQYYRAAPEIVWRDYEGGEITRLIECCKSWLVADPKS